MQSHIFYNINSYIFYNIIDKITINLLSTNKKCSHTSFYLIKQVWFWTRISISKKLCYSIQKKKETKNEYSPNSLSTILPRKSKSRSSTHFIRQKIVSAREFVSRFDAKVRFLRDSCWLVPEEGGRFRNLWNWIDFQSYRVSYRL